MQHILLADLPLTSSVLSPQANPVVLPQTARLCRQAGVEQQEALREDAQAAWLTPAERWLLHALRLPDADGEQAPWARLAVRAEVPVEGFLPDAPLGLLIPAHLHLGRDSLTLADPATLDLAADEAQRLFEAVEPLFTQAGWTLRMAAPMRWYVSHPSLAGVVSAGVARAQGRSVAAWMPGGAPARGWRQLLTEVQMTWQHHPVNEAREQSGRAEVNTLWLHGCGDLPPGWQSPLRCVAESDNGSADPTMAAALRGLAAWPALAQADALQVIDARCALADGAAQALQDLDARVAAALTAAMARAGRVRLTLAGQRRWITLAVSPPQDWKFWKRSDFNALLATV
ncbi:MAG: hypothetical protein AB7S55_04670 [Thiomonas sp.]